MGFGTETGNDTTVAAIHIVEKHAYITKTKLRGTKTLKEEKTTTTATDRIAIENAGQEFW